MSFRNGTVLVETVSGIVIRRLWPPLYKQAHFMQETHPICIPT
jgi:hypothetical protein